MPTHMPALRGALAAAIAGLAVIAGASVALAHAQYATSSPAANSTVTSVPSTLQVTYSEELSAIQITLTGPDGSNAASGTASIDLAHRTNASIALRDAGPGQYSVVWHNVSGDDGDPNDGAFVFTVAAAAGQAQPAPAAAPSNAPATDTSSGQAAPACIDNGVKTPGISDVRVDTYCKRQAIRDKFRGQIDEKTFNSELSLGVGLETALAEAMAELKRGAR